jgi:dihydroxyacetone kinase
MEITVHVTEASLDDVVSSFYDGMDEALEETTLRDVIVARIVERLVADADRWKSMTDRVSKAIDTYLRTQAKGYIPRLVAAEVEREFADRSQGAVTHGAPSTRIEAIVATEVTTQLRAKAGPVVELALADLRRELGQITTQAVENFREGLRR